MAVATGPEKMANSCAHPLYRSKFLYRRLKKNQDRNSQKAHLEASEHQSTNQLVMSTAYIQSICAPLAEALLKP